MEASIPLGPLFDKLLSRPTPPGNWQHILYFKYSKSIKLPLHLVVLLNMCYANTDELIRDRGGRKSEDFMHVDHEHSEDYCGKVRQVQQSGHGVCLADILCG